MQRDLAEAKDKFLPRKRAAKATKKFDARAAQEAPEKIDKNESNFVLHSIKLPGPHNRHLSSLRECRKRLIPSDRGFINDFSWNKKS